MAKIKTSEFTTYQEVGVAVDHGLVSPEAVRFAKLYWRYQKVREHREKEVKKQLGALDSDTSLGL